MLTWVGVAVKVLASPAERGASDALSRDVLSPTLVRPAPERSANAFLEGLLSNLAVVRRSPGHRGTDAMMLFVAVAPVSRYSTGLQVIGSF